MPSYEDEARRMVQSGSYHDGASYANIVYGRGGNGAQARAAFDAAEAEQTRAFARRRASTDAFLGGINDKPISDEAASAGGALIAIAMAIGVIAVIGYYALFVAVYAALGLAALVWTWLIATRPNTGSIALALLAFAGALYGLSSSGDIAIGWVVLPEISTGAPAWDSPLTRAILFATVGAPAGVLMIAAMRGPACKAVRRGLWENPARTRAKALAATLLPLILLLPALIWIGIFGYPGITPSDGQGVETAEALFARIAAEPIGILTRGTDGLIAALAAGSVPAIGLIALTLAAILASLWGATGARLEQRAWAQDPKSGQAELLEYLAERWIASRDIVEIAMIEKKISKVSGDLDTPFVFGSTFVRDGKVSWIRDHRKGFNSLKEETTVADPHHYRLLAAWVRARNGRIRMMLTKALKAEGFKRLTPSRKASSSSIDDNWQAPAR